MHLDQEICTPCHGGIEPLSNEQQSPLLQQLSNWQIETQENVPRLVRVYMLKPYSSVLNFVQQIGELAESVDHHPRVVIEWGQVEVNWWTHKIAGLHRNDFILAAKTDTLFEALAI